MARLAGLIVSVALVGVPVAAQEALLRRETHGGWTVSCSRDRMNDKVLCSLVAHMQPNSQQQRAGILIFRREDGGIEVVVSSSANYIPSGGALRIGRLEAENLKECRRTFCDPWPGRGQTLVDQMKSQQGSVYIRLQSRVGGSLEGDISLNGFSAAVAAFDKANRELK